MRIAVLCSVKLFPNLEAALKGVFNRVLTNLDLRYNKIGDEGAKAIADSLKSGMAVLTTLELTGNSIRDEGAKAIAEALKVTAVLTTLDLSRNSVGVEGAKAIADSLKSGMAVLTTLNLAGNSIRDEGAIAIAEALKVTAVLNFFPNASTRPKVITLWEVQCFRFLNASHFFPTSFHREARSGRLAKHAPSDATTAAKGRGSSDPSA